MPNFAKAIDWERLLKEFDCFEPDAEFREWDPSLFVQSLLQPVSGFVRAFIGRKEKAAVSDAEAVRDLYGFLLEKRYEEKLNLLHFAFNIFDESSLLPREVVDRTPFPHEDGVPIFKYINDPSFAIHLEPE